MNIKDSLKQVKEIEKETVERKAFKITEGNHYVNEDHAVKEFKQIADSGTIEELKSLTDALNELKNFISSSENLKIIEVSHLIKNLSDAVAWLGEKYNEFEDVPKDIENLRFKIKEEDDFLTERLKADFDDKITKLTARINKNYMGGSGGGIVFLKDADDVDTTSLADGRFIRWDASLNKFVFASASAAAGNVDLANVDQNIEPDQDSQRDLGSNSRKWKDLYLSGSTIRLGTVDLKSNSGSLEVVKVSDGLPASITSSFSVSDLSDVSGSPSDESVLKYNSTSGKWEPASAGVVDYNNLTNKPTIPSEINDLSDVNIGTLQNGRFLMYNGSQWISSVIEWSNITNKPTTIAGFGITDAFDGNYNSLTNKPSLFDGDYDSLTNKPTLFDGDYNSLSNRPSLFDGDYDSLTNKPTIPANLSDLSNVSSAAPSNGQFLAWTGTTWMPTDQTAFTNATTLENYSGSYYLDYDNFTNVPTIPTSIDHLSDVSLSSPQNESVLYYDGSGWIDAKVSWSIITNKPTLFDGTYSSLTGKPTIPSNISDLTDVNSSSPQVTDVLTWTANNSWQPQKIPAGFDGDYNSLTNKPTLFDGDYNSLTNRPTLYTNIDVNTHLNQSSASSGEVLSWNGSDYDWVVQSSGGGGATVSVSENPPSTPSDGDMWWDSFEGKLKIYYNDGSSSQWVDASPFQQLSNIDDLTDVSSATPSTGDTLTWTANSTWEPQQTSIDDLTDVSSATPSTGDILTWTANSTWEPQQTTASTSTPSQITGNNVHLTANTAYNRFDYNGHFIPTSNAQYDLGNAEYKVRHLFLSDNSLWIGDEHKMSIEGGKVKTKKRKKSVWPSSITSHSGWTSLNSAGAISWVNTTFSKTYTEVSELNLTELLSVLEYLNGNWVSVDVELNVTVNELFPPESSGNYTNNDYDNIFSQEPQGHRITTPQSLTSTFEIDLRAMKSYFVEQSPNYDPGVAGYTVNFHGAAPIPGATLDFTIFVWNGSNPKNITEVNINGVAASQVRTSGITPVGMEMCTYTIKGVCDTTSSWLLTIHVA